MSLKVIDTALDICHKTLANNKDKYIKQLVPCFWGAQGIGKTQGLSQWARENGYLPNIVHIGSMESPADLIGMQDRVDESGKTTYLLPDWFKFGSEPVLLILDEMNRGNSLLLQAMFPLLLDRMVGPHPIPNDCLIAVACNPSNGDFTVSDLDPALVNRMWHIPVRPKISEFLMWAENKINPDLIDFIDFHENSKDATTKIISLGADGNSSRSILPKIVATPRSWEFLNLAYNPSISKSSLKLLCDGLLGAGIYNSLISFTGEVERPIRPLDIFKNYREVRGYIEKWGSIKFNRIDLLDLTVQGIIRFLKSRKKSYTWAISALDTKISSSPKYDPIKAMNSNCPADNWDTFLHDLSAENLAALGVALDVTV